MAHEAVIEVDTSVGTLLTPAILPSTEKTLQLEVGDPERSDYSSSG
jgi:molybdopterin-binding protein